ncbi:hypothetical protein HMF7854_13060 [Sphingomonas ginkgonis]|uniref:Uncharacterized protein n=1 Tax=Sphingomonas ginkgonis TaxID=2315330 RepID=A0A3R9X943_9SPHN|nr:hypothetical protein [Sphingomonas ginkgonis]RST31660.1 hypothetical protein HMF7854_13060 [Sphingomonas ginkgonis]
MDRSGDEGLAGWLVDGAAAAAFACGLAYASFRLGGAAWVLPATSLGFGVALGGLRRVGSRQAPLRLPAFTPAALFDDAEDALLLTEVATGFGPEELLLDQLLAPENDELLLDDPLPEADRDARVVQLFGPGTGRPLPTAGELSARIDAHLLKGAGGATTAGVAEGIAGPGASVHPLNADASAALHHALADLKRTLASRRG